MSELPPLLRKHQVHQIFGIHAVKLTPQVSETLPHLVLPGDVRYPRDYVAALKIFSLNREGPRVSRHFIADFAERDTAAVLANEAVEALDAELDRFTFGGSIHGMHVKAALNIGKGILRNWVEHDVVSEAADDEGAIARASLDAVLQWHRPDSMPEYQPSPPPES
jgi:hypothetical protein